MKFSKRVLGKIGEARARIYLRTLGYRFVGKNRYFRGGEIDILMRDGDALVMVEVKTRTSTGKGYPEEAVSQEKIQRMYAIGEVWLPNIPKCTHVRCDIVSILVFQERRFFRIRHLKNVGMW